MKFNKISKKLAACSLAGVMMVSMTGMSVCAAGGVTGGTEASPITSVPVNKTVSAAENIMHRIRHSILKSVRVLRILITGMEKK